MSSHEAKENSSKAPSRLSQITNASASTDGRVPGHLQPLTEPPTSYPSSQVSSESTYLPQNGFSEPGSQILSASGDSNLPEQSFVSSASMGQETSLSQSSALVNPNEDFAPIQAPATPRKVATKEDALNRKAGNTLPTDGYTDYSLNHSVSTKQLADMGSSSRRQVQIFEEDAAEHEHWSLIALSPTPDPLSNPDTDTGSLKASGTRIESSAEAAETPPADTATPSDRQGKVRISLDNLQTLEGDKEAEHRSLMAPPPAPRLKTINIPFFPHAKTVESNELRGLGSNDKRKLQSLQNVSTNVLKSEKLDDWALSVPNPHPAEDDDDEDISDEDPSLEDAHHTPKLTRPTTQHRPSSSISKRRPAPHILQRAELQSALATRRTLDHETALLCAKRYESDQEIAALCAALGTPNEPGRLFDWCRIMHHLDQQLQVVQVQRATLRRLGQGTATLDLEVVRLNKALGVPIEAGFVAKRVISGQGESVAKRPRLESAV